MPGLLGVGGVVDLGRVAVPLGPAQVHPHQHLGEVGGVDPAGLGADGDQRVALVVLAGQQRPDLEGADVAVEVRPLGVGLDHELVRVGARLLVDHLVERREVVQARAERLGPLEVGLLVGEVAGQLLRGLDVVPQVGRRDLRLQLGDLAPQTVEVHRRLDAVEAGGEVLQFGRGRIVHGAQSNPGPTPHPRVRAGRGGAVGRGGRSGGRGGRSASERRRPDVGRQQRAVAAMERGRGRAVATRSVVGGPVLGEDVAAELVARGPPDRVGVVDPALGVVPLGEQPGALEPVVVRLAALGAAGPREVHAVEARRRRTAPAPAPRARAASGRRRPRAGPAAPPAGTR